ncbi:MAG: hypothetical protein KME54_11990 [Tolypothrix brevis GSE-NOS-MK-07-07A]|jgi:hypothetical protein|nr:hypothetical protein [Tolypothrix brevis GSE-NOS-MK-07-07A]
MDSRQNRLLDAWGHSERLQANAIASLSVGEAALELKQELVRPKKISLELSSQGLVGTEVNKYIKLHEKFGDAKHLFVGLGASMLITLDGSGHLLFPPLNVCDRSRAIIFALKN